MYFDEEVVLDLRLNTLDRYVDYFVIVESTFTHKGARRNLKFDHKKFEKFKNKIIYLTFDKEPDGIEAVYENDNEGEKSRKYILNAAKRENGQRDYIVNGLQKASSEDLILISDVDEIPNLEEINFDNLKEKILMFQQDMFYYKFDLKLPNMVWSGTKGCRKKDLLSPQWLRNIKDKKYGFFSNQHIFFDEVAENLDQDGLDGLYILLSELKKTKNLFVITHNNYLKSLMDNVKTLTITKSKGISSITGR